MCRVNKPNFFILGAAKSGTTSLYHHLRQHPDVFLPSIKEPVFFSRNYQVVTNPVKYFELYDSAATESALGEASTAYLSDPSTPRLLNALFPRSKFVVMLRHPADRAYSLYHHMRRVGFEHLSTFESALNAEEDRFSSTRFLARCPEYLYNFMYFRSGLYGSQLSRYLSLFHREQFHIVKLDDYSADPVGTYKEVLEFLGVSTDYQPEFSMRNEGKITSRFPLLQYIARSTPGLPAGIRHYAMLFMWKFNSTSIPPMPKKTRDMLTDRYTNDLALLYEKTGVRFS